MTSSQFKYALAELGLTPVTAAPYFGLMPRQMQRYAAGTPPVPHLVERTIQLLRSGKIKLEDLR